MIGEFVTSIDWLGLITQLLVVLMELLYVLLMSLAGFAWEILQGIGQWLYEGLFKPCIEIFIQLWEGICNIFSGIGQWFLDRWNEVWLVVEFIWNAIVQIISNNIDNIKIVIENVLNIIKSIWNNFWEGISVFAKNIWDGIVYIVSSIINGIKNTISNVLNIIKNTWENIWNGLKNTVTNIFNSIWNVIKGVINSILGGIEGMANGVIRGVNSVIKVLNNLHFNIPDWVPLFGGKSFGLSLKTLNEISLPRLAKGGIIDSPTVALMGEYAGVKSNPEIVTPENKMEDIMEKVISRNSYSDIIHLTVNVSNKKLGEILLDDLNSRRREIGKGLEALIG